MEYYKNLSLENIIYTNDEGVKHIEQWKDIINYEGCYQVSDLGRVKSLYRIVKRKGSDFPIKEKIRTLSLDKDGYMKLTLVKNNIRETFKIHQLVGVIFLGHVTNGVTKVIDHKKNNRRFDNSIYNLQIITHRENTSKDNMSLSRITGVTQTGKKFKVSLSISGKSEHIGIFEDKNEAKQVYLEVVKCIDNNKCFKHLKKKHKTFTNISGVCKNGKKFRALKYINGKQVHIGTYDTIELAKEAYEESIKK